MPGRIGNLLSAGHTILRRLGAVWSVLLVTHRAELGGVDGRDCEWNYVVDLKNRRDTRSGICKQINRVLL